MLFRSDADAAAPGDDRRPMTAAELRELTGSGLVTLGAHTRSHISLRFADDARLADELAGAVTDLTAISGVAPTVLAYPFGVDGVDVDARVVTATRRAGYQAAVLNGRRTGPGDAFRIPRLAVADLDGAGLLAALSSPGPG